MRFRNVLLPAIGMAFLVGRTLLAVSAAAHAQEAPTK